MKINHHFFGIKGIFIVAIFFIPQLLLAQWQQCSAGMYGGSITDITTTGSSTFATTGCEIFHSTNNGNSWVKVNNGLSDLWMNCLTVLGDTVFLGTDKGIFISADNGNSWALNTAGIGTFSVQGLGIIGSDVYACTNMGLYRSTNSGTSWSIINGLTSNNIVCIAFNGNSIFAGTYSSGVCISNDDGATWSPANNGLFDLYVHSLLVANGNIYAGTPTGGLYMSNNNGTSWTLTNNGLTSNNINSLITCGNKIMVATYGGLFYSVNNGVSWSQCLNGAPLQRVYSLHESGNIIFAGTSNGLYLSMDAGVSWNTINNGISAYSAYSLIKSAEKLYTGVYHARTFVSGSDGSYWNDLGCPIQTSDWSINTTAIAVNGDMIFIGNYTGDPIAGGILRSTDGGSTWSQVNNGLLNHQVYCITIYNDQIFTGTGAGLYHSCDNGDSWVLISNGMTTSHPVQCFTVQGNVLYAGTGIGVYRSEDDGVSWSHITDATSSHQTYSLLVTDSSIYAGTNNDGLFVSFDNGLTWSNTSNGLPVGNQGGAYQAVRCLLPVGNLIFAGTTHGVYFSPDYGNTWIEFDEGLTNFWVNAMVAKGNFIYAATQGASIWKRDLLQVGIDPIQNTTEARIYPNPAWNVIQVEYQIQSKEAFYSIMNINGQTLLEGTFDSPGIQSITAPALTNGLYYLRIIDAERVISLKFVKME